MHHLSKTLTIACLLGLTPVAGNAVQTCQPGNISASTPNSQFTNNDVEGTITDNSTGLMWKQCTEGQTYSNSSCSGNDSIFTWQGALQQADVAGFAGYTDWRLPNMKELASLVEEQCRAPAINNSEFPNTPPEKFWSSSPDKSLGNQAWYVDFSAGNSSSAVKTNQYRARLVRDTQ